MRIIVTLLIAVNLWGCSFQSRFTAIGGSDNPFIMFDNETAQACYAGSTTALNDGVADAKFRAIFDDKTPPDLAAYYFPGNKSGFSGPLFVELIRQSGEYHKLARDEQREANRLDVLRELPTCNSLLVARDKKKGNQVSDLSNTRKPDTPAESKVRKILTQ